MIHFFYSIISFVMALFFVMLGLVAIMIQASHSIRSEVIEFILTDNLFISLFGMASLLIGIAIVCYLISSFKKHYFKIKSDDNHVCYLDESLFQDYIRNYWKQLFPKHDIPSRIVLKRNKVLITADLPFVPDSQQKALLNRIDRDLKDIFTRLLGFRQKYVVSVSFQPEIVEHSK